MSAARLTFPPALAIAWVCSAYSHYGALAFVPFRLECCSPRFYDGSLLPFLHVSVQMSAFHRGIPLQLS